MKTDQHLVLTTITATAPGASGAAGAAVTGDSLTARNYGKHAEIVALWNTRQTAGFSQAFWPSAHDTTRGWRNGAAAATGQLYQPLGVRLPIPAQETISSTIAGSATAGDVEQDSLLILYDIAKGQRFMSWEELKAKLDWSSQGNQRCPWTAIEASLTSSAGPGYSGTESIDTDSNTLITNRDYALLGFSSRTAVHAIGWIGPDFGNDRIACPGNLRPEVTTQWFKLLSGALQTPLIPVFNSGNRSQTNWFVHTDENAGTFVCTAYLALLK